MVRKPMLLCFSGLRPPGKPIPVVGHPDFQPAVSSDRRFQDDLARHAGRGGVFHRIGQKLAEDEAGQHRFLRRQLSRGERLQIIRSDDELLAVDNWRFAHRLPSRAAAVRELLKRGLAAEGIVASDGIRSKDFGVIQAKSSVDDTVSDE